MAQRKGRSAGQERKGSSAQVGGAGTLIGLMMGGGEVL